MVSAYYRIDNLASSVSVNMQELIAMSDKMERILTQISSMFKKLQDLKRSLP